MESSPSKSVSFVMKLTPKRIALWAGLGAMMMLMCLALANLALSTPAWAVSADELLDLMVDEGAVTPEKAQKIKEKARKIDKVKKAEEDAKRAQELKQVKEEAKTEAKAEAKVEANKEAQAVVAQNSTDLGLGEISKALKGLNVGVLAYVDYSAGNRPTFKGPLTPTGSGRFGRNIDGSVGLNQFALTRGYLTVTKEITPWLYARSTTDIFQDTANGSWLLREKYLYAELRPPNLGQVLTQNKAEIGLGHTPWHDFEETIYPYRCQGTIPIERAGVFSSADIGVNIRGNFGGQLVDAKEKTGNPGYDGRYGGWHVGVYNGSGYNSTETTNTPNSTPPGPGNYQNKVPEYRVTLRPLPDLLPGLQLTYFGLYGKGNTSSANNFGTPFLNYFPDWIVNMGYLSYQNPWVILTGQAFWAKGNQAGNWTTQPTGPAPIGRRADSLWTRGYSVFGDVKVPVALAMPFWKGDHQYPLHVFFRQDWFDADQQHVIADNATYTKLITGVAYYLYKNNLIMLDYERTWYGSDYAAGFTRPGSVGGTGYNGTTARVAATPNLNGNLGLDQRIQVVFQISY
jgi:polyhydroxyalkanoate synthesis regulator phasin